MIARPASVISLFVGIALNCASFADEYAARPVRIITAEYGGGTDFVTRLLAQAISSPLGQNVIIENRGAAFTTELVTKAQPNGYTLGIGGATIWLSTILRKTS